MSKVNIHAVIAIRVICRLQQAGTAAVTFGNVIYRLCLCNLRLLLLDALRVVPPEVVATQVANHAAAPLVLLDDG